MHNPDDETRKFIELCGDFLDEVHNTLEKKGWTQAELAQRMGKSPAEVSRMINGMQNVTFRTIAKLSVALEEDIILTKTKAMKIYGKVSSPAIHICDKIDRIESFPEYNQAVEKGSLKIVFKKSA